MTAKVVAMSVARRERAALADLLLEVGPDAPTLCAGWDTRALAAHIVVRERRWDAGLGLMIPPVRPWTRRVQAGYAARPFERVVAMLRAGPSWPSPLRIPAVDRVVNTAELLVHHEDVRRARDGWAPRELPARVQDTLWQVLRGSSLFTMRARQRPCTVALARPTGERLLVGRGEPVVTVTGEPAELLLFSYGRQARTRVELAGPDDAVAAVAAAGFGT
jgi:uncharacterized protein (TIGR03085 family)